MTRSFHREELPAFAREASLDPSPVSLFTRDLLSHYDEPRSEGYDEFFDPPLESKYECPICLLGLREPVQTSCGHRFCGGCILRSIRDAGPKCPVDNERLNESQLYPDNFAKREMLSHDVFCRLKKQHGCPWKGPLGKLEEHFQVCLKYPQACEKCGQENIPRDMIDEHLKKECPNTEIECPFHVVGCTYKGLRASVNKHVIEQLTGHLTDMSKAIVALSTSRETEPQTQRTAPRRARGGLEAHPQEQAAQELYLSELSTQTHNHQGEIDELRHRITNTDNNVHHLGRQLEEIRMRQERPIQELIVRILAEVQQQRTEVNSLREEWNQNQIWRTNLLGALEESFDRNTFEIETLKGRFCNGSFTWKIYNFRQCLLNAINKQMTVIYSPPFYTNLSGYKLCMGIHLNGVHDGVGRQIALFVYMMQGDYDSILKWPFRERIELSILDQSGQDKRDNITYTLIPEPSMRAFQRPTTSRSSLACGFEQFAPIENICEGKYTKNGTMLVRAQVVR